MAEDAPLPQPAAPDLEALIAAIRDAQAQLDALDQERAQALTWQQSLEAQLAARLRELLGADLAAIVGSALALPAPPPPAPPAELEAAPPATAFSTSVGPAAPVAVPLPPTPPQLGVRGINYYPSQRGWWRMWCDWAPDEIGTELDLAKSLNVNVIRTFLPYSVVEARPISEDTQHICPTEPNIILDRVDQFLDMLDQRGMKAIIGLFDEAPLLPFWINRPLAALSHVDRIVNYVNRTGVRFGDDPRIMMWDLVNELDDSAKVWPGSDPARPFFIQPMFAPDAIKYYPTLKGDPIWPWVHEGLDWLKMLYNHVSFQCNQMITFGVLNPFSAVELVKVFPQARHIPQYHEYWTYTGNPTTYDAQIRERMRIIPLRTGRKALIGELGVPSNLPKGGITWTPALQATVTGIILRAARDNTDKVLGTVVWTLTDWNFPGTQENDEKYRGLFNADLTPKPAAAVVRSIYQAV